MLPSSLFSIGSFVGERELLSVDDVQVQLEHDQSICAVSANVQTVIVRPCFSLPHILRVSYSHQPLVFAQLLVAKEQRFTVVPQYARRPAQAALLHRFSGVGPVRFATAANIKLLFVLTNSADETRANRESVLKVELSP